MLMPQSYPAKNPHLPNLEITTFQLNFLARTFNRVAYSHYSQAPFDSSLAFTRLTNVPLIPQHRQIIVAPFGASELGFASDAARDTPEFTRRVTVKGCASSFTQKASLMNHIKKPNGHKSDVLRDTGDGLFSIINPSGDMHDGHPKQEDHVPQSYDSSHDIHGISHQFLPTGLD
ncbi:hypothetical protein VE02_04172 [Pseudogymnoascus sp. 03VT05]|nr:hypothetical protein VE02_04172 [Pseudogymnoascus sp. 03VT05]